MKTYKKIDILVSHRSSNFKSGYTDFIYVCSTKQHKTLKSAILSLNDTDYICEKIFDIKRCKSGMIASTTTGYNKILAIINKTYTSHRYNQKIQVI